ncbi:hypothetical protein MRB53_016286 [Persea americana]|uniref:Uncharacterized protein n=1 Tax=Persea americana TaxID=3435 RepID=A0ACC2M1N7_PERAE|nr:hypothetical protein MRB53_016286 [Persea americana]
MGSFHIFHFLSLLLLSTAEIGFCGSDSCKPSKCRKDGHGPVIRFPFRIKDRQPPYCGYPGFDVSCQDGNTLIHIPSVNGDVVVADIDYREERMKIIADPNSKDCIWRLLYKGLNFSGSPFVFDSSDTDNFTFISCSKTRDSSELMSVYNISCLCDPEHEVFVLEATNTVDTMQLSCEPMKTIAMSLSYDYNSGIRDYIYFILLRWDVPGCKECKSKGRECGFKNQSSSDIVCFDNHAKGLKKKYEIIGASIGSLLLLITIAAGVKVCFSWKLNRKLDLENEIKARARKKKAMCMTFCQGRARACMIRRSSA